MIEKLRKNDIKEYKELIDICFGSSAAIEEYERYDEENNSYTILVYKENNKIVGTITFYKIELFNFGYYPAIELFNVCVHPEFRKNNIAAKLIEYLEKYCQKNGYKKIFISCLEQLGDFYERIGFKEADTVGYYKIID